MITHSISSIMLHLQQYSRWMRPRVVLLSGFIFVVLSGCSENPLCVPGRVEACPCLPSGQGVQRCSEDGSRFLPCECGLSQQARIRPPLASEATLTLPSSESNPSSEPNPSSESNPRPSRPAPSASDLVKLHSPHASRMTQLTPRSSSSDSARPQGEATPAQVTTPRLVALEAQIEDVPSRAKRSSSSQRMFQLKLRGQQKRWWFYSETLERCVLAENVNGIDYAPVKLLSEGCYRLDSQEQMDIRCDDPPLGPQNYHFTTNESECVAHHSELMRLHREKTMAPQQAEISALAPVIEGSSATASSSDQADSTSSMDHSTSTVSSSQSTRDWYCMCYQERVDGVSKPATACRPTMAMCKELTSKVERGSRILVAGSVNAPCEKRQGSAPWDTFRGRGAKRTLWHPSSHPGAWWSDDSCFLYTPSSPTEQSKATPLTSTRSATRGERRQDASEDVPEELTLPIGTHRSLIQFGEEGTAPIAERCEESCRANLISPKQRQDRYGTRDVPPLLRWGATFAQRVKLVKTTCMKIRSESKRDEAFCLDEVIKKCTRYCERSAY